MSHSTAGRVRVRVAGLQPAQVLAGLAGIAFVVIGVAGFVRTGFGEFTGEHHATLLGFAINPLHNVVHLALGVLGLLMSTGSGLARTYGWILFLGYGAAFVWGLMLDGIISTNPVSGLGNPLNLNSADTWLHLGFAALGLLIAVLPARRKIVPIDAPAEPATRTAPEETADRTAPLHTGENAHRDSSIRDGATREEPLTEQVPTHRSTRHPHNS
ncbi:DUF4383 domain-containing protein [Umezawaea beigongshangensis]|uniref:DUF4383 domain-containing protein n=1 Tax=Umezawaea beigongshangensis TaxID=2780383 RepID=UPI0018F1D96C|nr:DUF4383 domain-containing protein [Umezawaea beigongshangensis]